MNNNNNKKKKFTYLLLSYIANNKWRTFAIISARTSQSWLTGIAVWRRQWHIHAEPGSSRHCWSRRVLHFLKGVHSITATKNSTTTTTHNSCAFITQTLLIIHKWVFFPVHISEKGKDLHLPHPLKMLFYRGFSKLTKTNRRMRTTPLVWWWRACWQNFQPIIAWNTNLKYTSCFIRDRSGYFKVIVFVGVGCFYTGVSNKSLKIYCVANLFVWGFQRTTIRSS